MRLLIALTILGASAAVAPAPAEPLDRLFSAAGVAQLPDGAALVYRHRREIGSPGGPEAFERVVRLERRPAGARVVATSAEGNHARELAAFRDAAGNPIALVFLDSIVALVSEASGANPFYLRNRIKKSLQERRDERPVMGGPGGSDASERELVLRPFEGDEHAEELGIFARLELAFRMSDTARGGLVWLRASAGDGPGRYFEEMVLDETT